MQDDHYFSKSRYHAQDTKKMNCPAVIILRDIVAFPTYKVIYIYLTITTIL